MIEIYSIGYKSCYGNL